MIMGGNIRMYITESCNARCPNCFNRMKRSGDEMDISHFEKLCSYFRNNGVDHLKIMGGEPTVHPDFSEMMTIAQKYFKTVSVFTNSISDRILDFFPREDDSIIYNFRFAKILDKKKLMFERPGRRSLEIQITSMTNVEDLAGNIARISKLGPPHQINTCLTLDCTENIFEYREALVKKYEYIWRFCEDLGFIMGQDHLAPFCFVKGTKIPIPKEGAICRISCAGLIDASYNVKFCNQFSDRSIPLIEDGDIIPFTKYQEFLKQCFDAITKESESKGCSDCAMYRVLCNGGCFAAKEAIPVGALLCVK